MRAEALARMAGMMVLSGITLTVTGLRPGRTVSAHGMPAQTSPPPIGAQGPTLPPGPPGITSSQPDEHDPARERMRQQAVLSVNEARHKRMEADAAKLLELSTELKSDVDKAGKDELSVEVIRKAAEIEKLAHDVKERMRQ